jgi:hypothetical protein
MMVRKTRTAYSAVVWFFLLSQISSIGSKFRLPSGYSSRRVSAFKMGFSCRRVHHVLSQTQNFYLDFLLLIIFILSLQIFLSFGCKIYTIIFL